ncbi:family 4 glycosyl hydrolase [Gandjariella thermophila]|uniref:6-phospho-beta-glucosidase n=1 Tax=Gandjariella thermophila TaxID=1931992 RepID=A0A4D4J6U4_9PSEU|nr:6-phospho-beta-glucosidase [Gandjariella thermophila]GDY29653.1 6-phospho-beta-glucosidase [Gandjariella thermophila]
MRLALLGGGGFRVPLVHADLLADPDGLVDELVLHDLDAERLAAITAVLRQQAGGATRPRLRPTTDLVTALTGADAVFVAIRTGGLAGRAADERIALRHGLLGQETVGPGGICFALRAIPVAVDIARRVAERAPGAWVVNFTNPAGMVTEAMAGVLGDRVIGVCDSPDALCRRVAGALGVDPERAAFDYVGLNHLGWLRAVVVDGRDRLPELLADDAALRSFEEGRLFHPEWLRALGALPNEYLHYYYATRETVERLRATGATRGEFLRAQQEEFYRAARRDPRAALRLWRRARAEREDTYLAEARDAVGAGPRDAADVEAGGYQRIALDLLRALATGRRDTMILDVRNRHGLAGLDRDAVVEVPCLVDAGGARPLAVAPVREHLAALMRAVRAVERDALTAATERDRAAALRAIAGHPLVDSVGAARRVLADYVATFPELADLGEQDGPD